MKIYWSGNSKNIIGNRVKALRLERNMTQKGLASQLQLQGYEFSDITILRIEKGKGTAIRSGLRGQNSGEFL